MELWKDIPEEEGYQISSLGQVKSLNFNHTGKEQILKTHLAKGTCSRGLPYERVAIRQRMYCIHRLMAQAFLPVVEGKPEVDHINNDSTDNRLDNLRWVDKSEQNINRRTPTPQTGERNIHLLKGWYQVKIKRNKKYLCGNCFRTLDEAVAFRDSFLLKINSPSQV